MKRKLKKTYRRLYSYVCPSCRKPRKTYNYSKNMCNPCKRNIIDVNQGRLFDGPAILVPGIMNQISDRVSQVLSKK